MPTEPQHPAGLPRPSAAGAMLRLGTLWGGLLGAGAAALGALGMPDAARAAASAGIGVVIALAALSAGPVLLAVTRAASPPAVMGIAITGYGTTVMVLAFGYGLLDTVPWLVGDRVAYGLLAATAGSLAGQLRAVITHRTPVYDEVSPSDHGVQ